MEGHGFMKPMHLSPVGLLSWWKDETKSFTLIFSIGKAECKQSAATDKSAQPRIQPLFKIAAVKGDAKAPRANESIKQANPMLVLLVMSSVSPSDALKELVSKQELAKALQKDPNFKIQPPASDCIASTQKWYKQRQAHLQQLRDIPSLFQMLCELPLPPVRWPKLLFGLSQPAVLAALEAQDVVEKSTEYQYVEVCCKSSTHILSCVFVRVIFELSVLQSLTSSSRLSCTCLAHLLQCLLYWLL